MARCGKIRNITVLDKEWKWQVGRSCVVLYTPEGKRHILPFEVFSYNVEDEKSIRPGDIADYIQTHF